MLLPYNKIESLRCSTCAFIIAYASILFKHKMATTVDFFVLHKNEEAVLCFMTDFWRYAPKRA